VKKEKLPEACMLILIDFDNISTPYAEDISQSTISTKKLIDDEKETFKTE
jgi:hypothetical protein